MCIKAISEYMLHQYHFKIQKPLRLSQVAFENMIGVNELLEFE